MKKILSYFHKKVFPRSLFYILILFLSLHLPAKSYTAVYFSFLSNQASRSYTDSSANDLSNAYLKNMLYLFGSIYGINGFEINFSLSTDKYYLPDVDIYSNRYLIALEGGKVFSFNLSSKVNPFGSSDFSIGAFYRLNFMGSSDEKKISGEYGIYNQIKLKINLNEKFLGLHSIDIGYKLLIPLDFNYYSSDETILTITNFLFVGVSF